MEGFATHVKELSALERHHMMIPMPMAHPELRGAVAEVQARMQACGILTVHTFDITRNLYAVAKASVDVLYEIINHIEAASLDERKMWDEVFCYGNNHPSVMPNGSIKRNRDYGAFYRRMMACQGTLLRVVAATDESNPQLRPYTLSKSADAIMIASERPLNDHASYRAALVFIGATDGFPPRDVPEEDLDFIAAHIDAVESSILDELMSRESIDRGLVQEMLSTTNALANGSL